MVFVVEKQTEHNGMWLTDPVSFNTRRDAERYAKNMKSAYRNVRVKELKAFVKRSRGKKRRFRGE